MFTHLCNLNDLCLRLKRFEMITTAMHIYTSAVCFDSHSNLPDASPPTQSITHRQYKHSQLKSRTINPLPSNTLLQTRSYRSQLCCPSLLVTKPRKGHTGGLRGQSKLLKDIKPLLRALCWPMDLGGDCYVKCRQRRRKWKEMTQAQWGTAEPGLGRKTLPGGCFAKSKVRVNST